MYAACIVSVTTAREKQSKPDRSHGTEPNANRSCVLTTFCNNLILKPPLTMSRRTFSCDIYLNLISESILVIIFVVLAENYDLGPLLTTSGPSLATVRSQDLPIRGFSKLSRPRGGSEVPQPCRHVASWTKAPGDTPGRPRTDSSHIFRLLPRIRENQAGQCSRVELSKTASRCVKCFICSIQGDLRSVLPHFQATPATSGKSFPCATS